jgi:hypothetical protein
MRGAIGFALVTLAAPGLGAQTLPEPSFETTPEVTGPAPTRRVWYGWQTLSVLGGAALVGAAWREPQAILFGAAAVTLGGPMVHWSHDHVGRGFTSLGLNVGLGLVGLGIGATAGQNNDLGGAVAGVGVGLAVALIIDVAALSYDEAPATTARRGGPWLAPDLRVARGGAVVGLSGAF